MSSSASIVVAPNEKRIMLQDQPGSRTIVLEKNAHLQYIISFTEKTSTPERSIIRFELKGDESHVEAIGLFSGKNRDTMAFETHTIHEGNHTFGHTEIKTLLTDEATSDYFGLIRIEKNTIGSDGHLSHAAMLLSEHARSKSVPALEIEANDVKAGHSASVGQMDEEAVQYMMSRGLTRDEALELMLDGFFEPLLEKIEDETIRKQLRKKLTDHTAYRTL